MNRGIAIALAFTLAPWGASCSSSSAPNSPASANDGFAEGKTFPEVSLTGYLDANHDGTLSPDEVRPLVPSDVLSSNPKAEILLVHVAFGWCKYCWAETLEQIKMTGGYGGRFVSIQVLVEDREGNPATQAFVDEW